MKFTKMHGLGNDYVYVNGFVEKSDDWGSVSKAVSAPHFGIGSDGLIVILPSEKADFKMRMFNADGSEGEMCGNGIRCVGKYVYDNRMTDKKEISVETLAGIKKLRLTTLKGKVTQVEVDMGVPKIAEDVMMKVSDKLAFRGTPVNMGNPHVVIFVPDADKIDIEKVGPVLEHHKHFPNRTNVEFVEVKDNHTLKMRVWERGSGETMACGTGACASVVAAVSKGKVAGDGAVIQLKGGNLSVRLSGGHVLMTGPATKVFSGYILRNDLKRISRQNQRG